MSWCVVPLLEKNTVEGGGETLGAKLPSGVLIEKAWGANLTFTFAGLLNSQGV